MKASNLPGTGERLQQVGGARPGKPKRLTGELAVSTVGELIMLTVRSRIIFVM
jgi:hypothetical protein